LTQDLLNSVEFFGNEVVSALHPMNPFGFGDQAIITDSAFLTEGFSSPHISNHRRARSWSQIGLFAKKNQRSGKR